MSTVSLLTREQLERHIERSITLHAAGYRLTSWFGGIFTVRTPKGREYEVDMERGSCTCDSRIQPCKHLKGCPQLICDTLDGYDRVNRAFKHALTTEQREQAEREAA